MTKHIFRSRQVAHVWAAQTQADGRNGRNTLFFDRATIYSYRRGFPLGRIFAGVFDGEGVYGGDLDPKPVALLLDHSPSHSTTNHLRHVRDAVQGSHHVIMVDRIPDAYGDASAHAANMAAWAKSIATKVAEARKAAGNLVMNDRRSCIPAARHLQATALDYGQLFAVPVPDAIVAFNHVTEMAEYNRARHDAEMRRQAKREADEAKHGISKVVARDGRRMILADARRAARIIADVETTSRCVSDGTRLPWRLSARIRSVHASLTNLLAEHPADATARKWFLQIDAWMQAEQAEVDRYEAERQAERVRREAEKAAAKAMIETMSREQMVAAIIDRSFPSSSLHLVPDGVQAEAWRQGAFSGHWQTSKTMLRLKPNHPDVIETSRGAEFPTAHGVRAWRILRGLYAQLDRLDTTLGPAVAGSPLYVRNGATIHLGHFSIDRVNHDGTVVAGCHRISREEVEALATTLGLDKPDQFPAWDAGAPAGTPLTPMGR